MAFFNSELIDKMLERGLIISRKMKSAAVEFKLRSKFRKLNEHEEFYVKIRAI